MQNCSRKRIAYSRIIFWCSGWLRERQLFLTEKGKYISKQHRAYDRKMTCDYLIEVAKHCTPEEINGFFKMTHYRSEYFEKVLEQEKEIYKKHSEEK